MTPTQCRAALDAAGLRQVDFKRLLAHLPGQPADAGTINRWATGRRAVPPNVVAILALWSMLPKAKQHQIRLASEEFLWAGAPYA